MKICTGVDLADVIMDIKFKVERISVILMSLWVKVRPFPSTLHVGLTTTALPVISKIMNHDLTFSFQILSTVEYFPRS